MDKQMSMSREFVEKAYQCAQGNLSAMEWMYLHFNAELSEEFFVNEEKFYSNLSRKEAVKAMGTYLHNKAEELLSAEAMGFWLNRAAFYGSGKAREYLEKHPFFQVCCFFPREFYSGNVHLHKSCSGKRLRQLGLLTFDEAKDFSMDSLDKNRIFKAEKSAGYEGPDEDGYGMEEEYNFLFYDEFFNPLLQLSSWSYRDLRNNWECQILKECLTKKAEYQKQRDDYWQRTNDTSQKYQIPYGCIIENGVVTGYIASADESKAVVLPDGVKEIARNAFIDCASITSITMPKSIEKIGISAFEGCGIETFAWPEQLLEIPEKAFWHCHNLKSIIIPDGVKKIGHQAFLGCWELEEIYIPDSVEEIGQGAFQYCRKLKSFHWSERVHAIPKECFFGCESVLELSLPEGVTAIGEDSFAVCHSIKELTLPHSVQVIEQGAFHYCKGLIKVIWPKNVPVIAEKTFDECKNLKLVVVPSTVTKIHPKAFSRCEHVKIRKRNSFLGFIGL